MALSMEADTEALFAELLTIDVKIAPTYQGRRACCGERWLWMETRQREGQWWAFMVCPACGDMHGLPLVVPAHVQLRVTAEGVMASKGYMGQWEKVRVLWD